VSLARCEDAARARCGSVTVPLDRAHPGGDQVPIAFELYRHTRNREPSLGTIVAVEGGPGYSTRASRDSYLDLFGPLLDRRDLLLVDNRGTGGSGAIDCPPLQSYVGSFVVNAGKCGRQLGPAADDYGSANAAEDLVAVLDALGILTVDLYGDSYGTFFSQTFAVRHPERLRSLVLDASYPIEGSDPWYRDSNRALRAAFRAACARDARCAARGGDPIARLTQLLDRVRAAPITGDAYDADGTLRTVTVDGAALAAIAWNGSSYESIYRELDAAARAALRPVGADVTPLLRLAAENLPAPGGAGDPVEFSEGAYAAVSCNDYPEPWDVHASFRDRRLQYSAAKRALPPSSFAPFSPDEWLYQPGVEWDYCARWPAPTVDDPPFPVGGRYPRVPTLVLAGDLDSNTSPEGGRTVARKLHATYVEVANTTHVTALGDLGHCASRLVLTFVAFLTPGDTSCAAQYAETRLVPDFVRTVGGVAAPRGDVVTAVAATAGDVMARWWSMYGTEGVGLRGGTFTYSGDRVVVFRLHDVRWAEDLPVRGTVRWDRVTGEVVARLRAPVAPVTTVRLDIAWNDLEPHAIATATGSYGDAPVVTSIPAP
jgi:pimeloyl-ACP methyl ester carboxylesterase